MHGITSTAEVRRPAASSSYLLNSHAVTDDCKLEFLTNKPFLLSSCFCQGILSQQQKEEGKKKTPKIRPQRATSQRQEGVAPATDRKAGPTSASLHLTPALCSLCFCSLLTTPLLVSCYHNRMGRASRTVSETRAPVSLPIYN